MINNQDLELLDVFDEKMKKELVQLKEVLFTITIYGIGKLLVG